jgi:hypothetical protein
MTDGCVHLLYYITTAGNSISTHLGSSCKATGTVRKRQAVWPVHHIQNHTCRVTFLQPARRAAVLGQPSSIRPHCGPLYCRNIIVLPCCPWTRDQPEHKIRKKVVAENDLFIFLRLCPDIFHIANNERPYLEVLLEN